MKCPKCGAENPENSKFCGQCGSLLEQKCRCSCGAELPAEALFCPECGMSIVLADTLSCIEWIEFPNHEKIFLGETTFSMLKQNDCLEIGDGYRIIKFDENFHISLQSHPMAIQDKDLITCYAPFPIPLKWQEKGADIDQNREDFITIGKELGLIDMRIDKAPDSFSWLFFIYSNTIAFMQFDEHDKFKWMGIVHKKDSRFYEYASQGVSVL